MSAPKRSICRVCKREARYQRIQRLRKASKARVVWVHVQPNQLGSRHCYGEWKSA